MKNILLDMTNQKHSEFLETIGFTRDFDPYKLNTWHHDFNLQERVSPVPIFEIKEKPDVQITQISDLVKDNDIKNNLVKRALENINATNDLDCKNTKSCEGDESSTVSSTSNFSKLSKTYSAEFLKKLQAKEQAVHMSKQIIEYTNHVAKKKNNSLLLKEICDSIKTIMLQQNSPMRISELISKILYNSTSVTSTCNQGIYNNNSRQY